MINISIAQVPYEYDQKRLTWSILIASNNMLNPNCLSLHLLWYYFPYYIYPSPPDQLPCARKPEDAEQDFLPQSDIFQAQGNFSLSVNCQTELIEKRRE